MGPKRCLPCRQVGPFRRFELFPNASGYFAVCFRGHGGTILQESCLDGLESMMKWFAWVKV